MVTLTQTGVIGATLAIFLIMILQLALAPAYNTRLMGILLGISVLGGVLVYGYGYGAVFARDPMTAALRSLLSVCGMFVGKNDLGEFLKEGQRVAQFENHGFLFFFWLVHLLALYTTASAAITTVGRELLKRMNLLFTLRGDLALFLGTDPQSLEVGEQCRREGMSVVFVDRQPEAAAAQRISRFGAALRTDQAAWHPDAAFLRSLRMGNTQRKLTLYALSIDEEANRSYAQTLIAAMEEAGIAPQRTSLVLFGSEEMLAASLQSFGETHYGFGYVSVVSPGELSARVMLKTCPPWECLSFDGRGRALGDLDVLVVGFGRTGQAVFRQLLMNGQFEGSTFRAAVSSPDCRRAAGLMQQMCPEVFRQYDVTLMNADDDNRSLFQYIYDRRATLNYIAVCVGDEQRSLEISQEILRYLNYTDCRARVVQCLRDQIRCADDGGRVNRTFPVLQRAFLNSMEIDRMAMALNHSYTGRTDTTPWEDWKFCDYFSRMSSRASVDFIPALLFAVGISPRQAAEGDWPPSPEAVEVLARTEHRRWCAFHFAMGFSPMSREEFEGRAERYRQEMAEQGSSRVRISKNMSGHTHACLIPWEALDDLSERENAVTGGSRDYQQEDLRNVLAIPQVLRETDGEG